MINRRASLYIPLAALGMAAALAVSVPGSASGAAAVSRLAAGPEAPGSDTPAGLAPPDPQQATEQQRDALLGPDWRTSNDQVVVGRGDATGFHLLVANESEGYTWRTTASLSEPGVETDRWIGNVCVTGSGRRAVVAYAPRTWTNEPQLAQRGAFTAVVDLTTGAARKLPVRSSLAYFSPGCGSGETAVVTQARGGDDPTGDSAQTRLLRLDAETGKVSAPITLAGQITSAVPSGDGIVAAAGRRLVSVDGAGKLGTLAATASVPFRVTAERTGAVTYLDAEGDRALVRRVTSTDRASKPALLADGKLTEVDLSPGADGSAFVTGAATARTTLPATVRQVTGARPLAVSSLGHLSVTATATATPYPGKDSRTPNPAWVKQQTLARTDPDSSEAVAITELVHRTGRTLSAAVTPGQNAAAKLETGSAANPLNVIGRSTAAPSASGRTTSLAAGSPTNPVEAEATCAVARNDAKTQVYQPTARQVEWAADQAVVGNLRMTRAANWKEAGMASSWTPQGLFPPLALDGGGRVPVQVFLGIMAQESNLWQASGHALSGVPGNPLIGNYYGRDIYDESAANDWDVDFSDADCGYGITQITDGMRKPGSLRPGEVALSATQQRAAAVDYATNIAGGLRILQDKWNQTKRANIVHSNGDPKWLENWFFAVWAYNSGLHPASESGAHNGAWGLGWLNNPANPNYVANRTMFGAFGADASHPQDWPYPEKVLGFAAYSIATTDGPGFRPAWWVSATDRDMSKPAINAFCTAANNCTPGAKIAPTDPDVINEPAGPCAHKNSAGQYDLECWWHTSTVYHNCASGYCGNELLRFDTTYPEQPDGTNYPPKCDRGGLPSTAVVVDDVPATTKPISTSTRPCAAGFGPNGGAFAMNFGADAQGRYPSKVDLHQLGAGYGGHMYFGHSRKAADLGGKMRITGTWTFDQTWNQWGRVFVHMPDIGAHTQQAAYKINLGNGTSKTRYALQRTTKHQWKSLGVVQLAGRPSISLSTETKDGVGDDDVAWDAVAVQPLSAKPRNFVVALGDSYTSGEGASDPAGGPYGSDPDADDYDKESDYGGELADDVGRNACHRSPFAWPRKAALVDNTAESLGARNDRWDTSLDFQFHACSGARTHNINPQYSSSTGSPVVNAFGKTAGGQYGEMSQLDKGYLDANTTLVMLSVGGNDARFADIITECIFAAGLKACPDAHLGDDPDELKVSVPKNVNGPVKSSIDQTVRQIRLKAPNAKILLMGYPKLLENSGSCVLGIGTAEAPWLNDLSSAVMAPMMQGVADNLRTTVGIPVYFSNPISDFAGKAICGSPESIHAIVENTTAGDKPKTLGLLPPSSQSFHPKIGGTTLYATSANRTLRVMGQ